MKISNYILLGFLIFFFGSITALHIDSSNHKEAYIKLMIERSKINNLRNDFFTSRTTFSKNKNPENWNKFLKKAKIYFSNDVTYPGDYNTVAWTVYYNYKDYDTKDALFFARDWAKRGVDRKPEDGHMHDTYANLLFDLGFVEDAVKHQQIAYDIVKAQGHEWTELYEERLNRFKSALKYSGIKVGSKYIDVTPINFESEDVKLSKVIKGKVTILSFWAPITETSNEKNRLLLPIFNEFKTKEFQIVGITKALLPLKKVKDKLQKENLPWMNLLDFKNRDRIWDKYGVFRVKNRIFLLDKTGTIISIDPTIEELRKELKKLF
jgi:hypothetical protein